MGGDRRWPRFGARVGRLGVRSVLSLPLRAGDDVVGAMNVYAHAKDAFDERAERLGELFAVPAAIAVQNAQILAQTQRLATNLRAALTNRAVIDQAIGIMMSRSGMTEQEAFVRLRDVSQRKHAKQSGNSAAEQRSPAAPGPMQRTTCCRPVPLATIRIRRPDPDTFAAACGSWMGSRKTTDHSAGASGPGVVSLTAGLPPTRAHARTESPRPPLGYYGGRRRFAGSRPRHGRTARSRQ